MKKIAFLVNHLGPNQITCLLAHNISHFLPNHRDYDICIFYESIVPPAFHGQYAALPSSELWGYDGACISFGPEMLKKMVEVPTLSRKIHFSFDFDWLYNSREFLHDIEYAVRTEAYAEEFKKVWGRTPHVFGDIDVEKISSIVSGREESPRVS